MEYLLAVRDYFSPPPVSPLFKEGGALYGYNEDLTQMCAALAGLFLVHNLLVRPFVVPKAQYFALHAVVNFAMVCVTLPDVIAVLSGDPRGVFQGPMQSMMSNSLLFALHLYHMLTFKVTSEDVFHHVLFSFIVAPFVAANKLHFGRATSFDVFFLSGLPGGIDYVLLVLHYHGFVSRKTEKSWFATVNVWLRGPGLIAFGFIAYINWFNPVTSQASTLPPVVALFSLCLSVYNGQLYSRQAVESYTKFTEKEKLAREDADKKTQ
jgi:hypothetical protein